MEDVLDFSNGVVPVVEEVVVPQEPITFETTTDPVSEAPITDEQQEPIIAPITTFEQLTNGKFKSVEEVDSILSEYEALKNAPKFDYKTPLAKSLDEYVANGGDPYKFIEASRLDVDSMSLIEKAKAYYKYIDNTNLAPEDIEALLIDEYKQVEDADFYGFSEHQVNVGKAKLARDVAKFEKELTDFKTKSMTTPEAPKAQEPIVDPAIEEQNNRILKDLQEKASAFNGHKVALAEDDFEGEVNVPVYNADFIKAVSQNPSAIFDAFTNPDGSIDYAKFLRVANYASNPDAYEKTILKTGISNGRGNILNKINNPSTNQATKGDLANKGLPEGMTDREFILNQFN